jgi:hypothetical protein
LAVLTATKEGEQNTHHQHTRQFPKFIKLI